MSAHPPTSYERFVEATKAILSVPKKDVEPLLKERADLIAKKDAKGEKGMPGMPGFPGMPGMPRM